MQEKASSFSVRDSATESVSPRLRGRSYLILSCAAGMLAVLCLGPSALYAQRGEAFNLPAGNGKELVATACASCHSLSEIVNWRDGRPGWKKVVEIMVLRGARMTPQEVDTVLQYLVQNFGPNPQAVADSAARAAAKPVALPPGPGKNLVESRCTACHDLNRVVTVKRSRLEWEHTTNDMISRGGQATPEQIQTITSYLAAQFGKEGY